MIGALMLAPAAANSSLDQTVSVKVGLLTPVTGGLSAYSGGFERAAQLAVWDLNNDSAFDGYTFDLSVYDTQTSPEGSSAAMTAAVDAGVHYAVGAAGSSNTLAAMAVAVANKVPMISYASTSPLITTVDDHANETDEGYLWRTPPSDALQGKVLADLANSADASNMVIVALDNAYGSGLANSTKDNFELTAGNIATIVTYAETQTDFATTVQTVLAEEPDVVVAISYATDGSLFFVELDAQGYSGLVIGADGVADEGIFNESDGTAAAMEGFVLVKPSAVASNSSAAFAAAYAAAYPDASGDIYTAETYDAVMAGALAVLAGASTDGEDIIANLGDVSFDGATGPIGFDENGDSTAGFYQISAVASAEIKAVATWDSNGLNWTDSTFDTTAWTFAEVTSSETSSETSSATNSTSSETSEEGGLPLPVIASAISVFAVTFIARRKFN
jgi:ABC-type branched-subunit amino acid transport system substrate-binding protein